MIPYLKKPSDLGLRLQDIRSRFPALPVMPNMAAQVQKHLADTPLARFAPHRGAPHGENPEKIEALAQNLIIPVADICPAESESDALRARGTHLARQDMWEEFSEEFRAMDRDGSLTQVSQVSRAELLGYGARADLVAAGEHAVNFGAYSDAALISARITEMEGLLEDHPKDYAIAYVVAMAHIDLGWAWRGTGRVAKLREEHRRNFTHHFARAREILAPYCALELESASLAAAQCALLPASRNPNLRVADDFEDLIDLAPHDARHLRAFGNYLLPRWYGDYDQLELEARRTAARTQDIWGAGGYAWIYFDAMLVDPRALSALDLDFFSDGLADILMRRDTQHMANLLAAHGAEAIRAATRADHARAIDVLTETFEYTVTAHLRELHPLIWGHADLGFDNAARVASPARLSRKGHEFALNALRDLFQSELRGGDCLQFTPEGIRQLKS